MTEQIYHPYTDWEDYGAGMWRGAVAVATETETAARILGDPDTFYAAATDMVRDWPKAAEHNLTNREQNRRAWVGQAAVCYLTGIPESVTRGAWWFLLVAERDAANAVADRVIAEWEAGRDQTARPALFSLEEFRSA